jgi:hypothetical protein
MKFMSLSSVKTYAISIKIFLKKGAMFMAKDKQEVLDELTDMFNGVQPDQEYLDQDEDTAESVEHIQELLGDPAAPVEEKIESLIAFNEEWFPDGLSDSEQNAYRTLLDEARVVTA